MGLLASIDKSLSVRNFYSESQGGRWISDIAADRPSGLAINERTAFGVADYLKCVRVLTEDVAKTPLKIYERIEVSGSPGVQDAVNHGLFPILTAQPNDYMTAFTFKETLMGHLLSWGNAYIYVEKYLFSGKAAALWIILPPAVRITYGADGEPVYNIRSMTTGSEEVFANGEIVHIHGLGYDGIRGYSMIEMIQGSLGWAKSTSNFGAQYFRDGSMDGGLIEHPAILGDEARKRLRNALQASNGGANRHRIAILDEGMKFVKRSITNNEAQFLETLKFQRTDIGGLMRVVLHKIGDYEKATFTNVEELNTNHVGDSLMPWYERIQQSLNMKLLTPQEKRRFFISFQPEALMRGNTEAQTDHCRQMFNAGAYSPNRILRFFGENPYEGGDEHYIPLNMVPVSKIDGFYDAKQGVTEPKPNDNPPGNPRQLAEDIVRNRVRSAYKPLVRDAVGRVLVKPVKDRPRAIESLFRPIAESLAEGLELKDPEFVTEYLNSLGVRAKEWTPSGHDSIADAELERIASAFIERCTS